MAENEPQAASLAAGGDTGNSQATATASQTQDVTVPEYLAKMEGLNNEDRSKLARYYPTVNKLAKSALEFDKRISASIVIPGKDATPAEKEEFAKRLGRPESPDGYELDQVYLPDGVTRQNGGEDAFKKMAYELGLTKDQGKKLYKYATTQAFEGVAAMRKEQENRKRAAAEALKKEWGSEYDGNLAKVQKVNKLFGDDDWVQFLNEGAGNDSRLVKVLVKIAKQFSEDTLETGRLAPRAQEKKEPGLLDYGALRPEISGDNRYRKLSS